jgi:O-antigen ligase
MAPDGLKRMPRTTAKRQHEIRRGAAGREERSPSVWRRLTQAAFGLTLVLVAARVMMQEILRNPWLPMPGSTPLSAMPGPASSIALDLLCCLPALLVLARRLVDPDFALRFAWSTVPMFALAAWTLVSVAWSSDRFAAIVNAFHWASALVLLWSTAQLVRSWVRLRLIAAVSFGLLMVLLVQGYYYRFVDLPDLQQDWRQHHGELLAGQGGAANSTEMIQLGKNIEGGVPTGFNVSRNTYAAVLVLLMVIAAGVVMQRIADGDGPGWWAPVAAVIAVGLFMLYRYVQSKTAFATPVIAAGVLALLGRGRGRAVRRPKRAYWAGVGAFALIAAAVVGHGLRRGTLFHVSLTFRWQYWVGAARVFVHHPWLGTGWANFGSWYTAYRLPQAAEEPTDPHNFLVRAFVELGVVGGVLTIAWMLRLWWEWTTGGAQAATAVELANAAQAGAERSAAPGRRERQDTSTAHSAFPLLITLSVIAIALNAAVSIDWTSQPALLIVETFKRLLFLIALLLGTCFVGVQSIERQVMDERPARWILTSVLVGLGLFLLHNLIDFSLFEIGPMFLFALLAGAALGVRLPSPQTNPHRGGLPAPILAFIAAGVAWLVAAGALWAPVAQAESLAQDADEEIRTSRPPATEGVPQPPTRPDAAHVERAEHDLLDAWRLVPYNADYAFRAEQAGLLNGAEGASLKSRELLDAAVAADPRKVRYLNARAALEAGTGDDDRAARDYQQILRLDPHNLELRSRYAALLDRIGRHADAVEQYRQVLQFNGALAKDEIRRLSERQEQEIRQRVGAAAP